MYHVQEFDIHIATFKAITVSPRINSRSNNLPPPKRCPPHRPCISNKRLLWISSPFPQGWIYSGFQVMGMIEWGQKSKPNEIPRASNKTPQKSLDQKLTPQKPHAEFLRLKNLQKALNDITRKIWTIEIECLCLFIHHNIWIYRLFWISPKIPYFNQATQEKWLPNFSTPKSLRG